MSKELAIPAGRRHCLELRNLSQGWGAAALRRRHAGVRVPKGGRPGPFVGEHGRFDPHPARIEGLGVCRVTLLPAIKRVPLRYRAALSGHAGVHVQVDS
jgi:hypothetical protein